jgi:hypothetical protein
MRLGLDRIDEELIQPTSTVRYADLINRSGSQDRNKIPVSIVNTCKPVVTTWSIIKKNLLSLE